MIEETLAYYDAANSLKYLHIPVLFNCALFDPAVAPPGQWAAANSHAGPKEIVAFPTGHFEYDHPSTRQAAALYAQNSRA